MLIVMVTAFGASEGFILNEEATLCLNVKTGDTLCLTEVPGGALRITPYDPDFVRQMALAETVMHDDRAILRVLA
ncbi:hypothetical protein RCH09_003616 [Actimicrobium sp. GrIS 1.19]|uniref:transcriptional regulator n=1 Tax=Actimicrobium sp. GrIS 1.19 TaxID=3071708 RepID=UPI002DFB9737|nr:hypothetical protein [Actimicrobium sp. GrIS 1.19]